MTATTEHTVRVPAPRTAAPSARTRRTARRRRLGAAGVLMAPFFLLLTTVFLIPVGTAAYLSFYSDDQPGLGFGPEHTVFVGLRSYAAVLTDPTFLGGLGTVAVYCLIYIPLMVVGALLLALLLDSGVVRLRAFAQLGLFLPHAVPGIIAALIWLYLYTPRHQPGHRPVRPRRHHHRLPRRAHRPAVHREHRPVEQPRLQHGGLLRRPPGRAP
ncbi:hypothetical protein SUDANB21_00280 [Streptomyces sp. enrichment culture]